MEIAGRIRSGSGQSTVEWVGLTLLVAGLMVAVGFAGVRVPGVALLHSISRQVLCAVSLSETCDRQGSLEGAYGHSAARLVRDQTPELLYGRDMLGLPVDFRTCRSAYCAEGPAEGAVTESEAGEAVTLFTRVVDCRAETQRAAAGLQCEGEFEGSIWIQYWAYYPESASLRGAPVLEDEGYHRHDWESVQVRIEPDGTVSQRASSHAGHNHSRSTANWGSDMGWGFLSDLAETAGLRESGGWGRRTGQYLIAGGSHAGNVADDRSPDNYPSHTPAGRIRLVPLETIRGDALSRSARFDPITPPWRKQLWLDPQAEGTG
ncbi:MAG: hypothetical protein WBW44_02860 [Solirubrobacterales bacterium]